MTKPKTQKTEKCECPEIKGWPLSKHAMNCKYFKSKIPKECEPHLLSGAVCSDAHYMKPLKNKPVKELAGMVKEKLGWPEVSDLKDEQTAYADYFEFSNSDLIPQQDNPQEECGCCCHLWSCVEDGKHQTDCQHCSPSSKGWENRLQKLIKQYDGVSGIGLLEDDITQLICEVEAQTKAQIVERVHDDFKTKLYIALNLFASDIDLHGYSPENHKTFVHRILDDAIAVIQRGKEWKE